MKAFKKLITLLLITTASTEVNAQKFANNTIYLEAGGNAHTFYSVNYDYLFKLSEQFKLAPRVGFSYIPMKSFKLNTDYGNIRIPLEVNALWANKADAKNFAELGLGLSLIQIKAYEGSRQNYQIKHAKITTLRAGFRHQKPSGGLMYRLGILAPITQDEFSKKRFVEIFNKIMPGASMGYSF